MAVRRVRRIIRRVDPWTVLKVSLVFNAIAALIFVLGTWVTWSLALRRGIPGRIVDIFESLTLTITIEGELYFRIVVLLAIIGAILAMAFMTLGAVLYNLIADLVGGVEVAVLEETYRPAANRTRMRPAPAQKATSGLRAQEQPLPATRSPGRREAPQPEAPVEVPIPAAAGSPQMDRDGPAPPEEGETRKVSSTEQAVDEDEAVPRLRTG